MVFPLSSAFAIPDASKIARIAGSLVFIIFMGSLRGCPGLVSIYDLRVPDKPAEVSHSSTYNGHEKTPQKQKRGEPGWRSLFAPAKPETDEGKCPEEKISPNSIV